MLNKFSYFIVTLITFAGFQSLNAQVQDSIVAVMNGREITQSEVDASIIGKLLPLQEQINILRKAALENLILKTLLAEEAKKRGIPIEDLRKSLSGGKIEISSAEIERVYLENVSAFASMSSDEAKERVRLDLESQARMRAYRDAVQKLKQQAIVELRAPEIVVTRIKLNEEGPAIGNSNAPVTIIEFSDFQCVYCRQSFSIIKQLLRNQGSNIRFIYKHSLLSPRSFPAAQASVCAAKQGKFWEYHDALFASEDFTKEGLDKIAERIVLNVSVFKNCLSSADSRSIVLKDIEEAKRLGIEATPSFFINGKLVRGAISLEEFNQIIEDELKINQKSAGK